MNVADWTVKISIKRMWLLKTAAYVRFFTDVLTKKFLQWAATKSVKIS